MFYVLSQRLYGVAALLALLWPRPAFAQDHTHDYSAQRAVTLDEIVERIVDLNPDVRAARLHAAALDRVPAQVSALPDPTVSVGYQPYPILTARGEQRSQWMIEQNLPYPGKLGLREDIARLDAREADLNSEALLEDLILQAKEAYFELYRLNEFERLIADFHAELEGFEDATAVRYEIGSGPQQALLKAQLEKNQLARRLHHIEGARRRAAETLAYLTNQPEGPRYFLTAEPVLAVIDGLAPGTLAETAVERRPEFAALEAAAERAARQVELARKEVYPDFGLRVSYHDIAASDVSPMATGRDAVAVGLSVKIPIQRGRIRAGIEEARLREDQIEARQEALRSRYRTQIEELLATLDHEARSIDEYENILLPQAATLIEAATNAYSSGVSDYLELLDAERTAFALRTGYIDAVTQYLVAFARLERAIGVRDLSDASLLATDLDAN